MDAATARAVLRVGDGVVDDELRHAYRAALRRSHPDLGGRARDVQQVIDAYRTLLDEPIPAAPPPAPPATAVDVAAVTVDGDTVAAELPAGDLFPMLLEVAHGLGQVAYVDDLAGILEIVVTFEGYGACSVVLTLQGRGTGTTEASCTVEALGPGPTPPPDAVAELLAEGLRTLVA
jgi:hypothetical protein